jgi:hypothetical protein
MKYHQIKIMQIVRVFILFFILVSPLKANTIYNLIRIPNLEVYELKTPNKLKYLYAEKSFRLGVEKNIVCLNPDQKTLDEKYKIISKNLNNYSTNFIKKINLKYIVMCENLSISGINTAGLPDNVMKTLILDIKFDEKYFERVIHHELFHIINDNFKNIFDENEWKKFNKKDFEYAECSTCTEKRGLDTYNNSKGFFTEYSMSTASEDMAEVFSHLAINADINNEDQILVNKVNFIKEKMKLIDSEFKF